MGLGWETTPAFRDYDIEWFSRVLGPGVGGGGRPIRGCEAMLGVEGCWLRACRVDRGFPKGGQPYLLAVGLLGVPAPWLNGDLVRVISGFWAPFCLWVGYYTFADTLWKIGKVGILAIGIVGVGPTGDEIGATYSSGKIAVLMLEVQSWLFLLSWQLSMSFSSEFQSILLSSLGSSISLRTYVS